MRLALFSTGLLALAGVCQAGDLSVHILLSGQVAPGVYGQVQIGQEAPPPLVYPAPMLITRPAVPAPPIYLHVPPGHAKNWRKHCREYDACSPPVYFVRSEEYEPGYVERHHGHDHDHGRDHDRDHDHGD